MHKIKQSEPKWCALACLESASRDQNGQQTWTQKMLFDRFSMYFSEEGINKEKTCAIDLIPTICFHAGLGNCFHLGEGKDYAYKYKDALNDKDLVILVHTRKDKEGGVWGHCLRISEMNDNGFYALDPSTGTIKEDYSWSFLTEHSCFISVIGRTSLSTNKKEAGA